MVVQIETAEAFAGEAAVLSAYARAYGLPDEGPDQPAPRTDDDWLRWILECTERAGVPTGARDLDGIRRLYRLFRHNLRAMAAWP